VGADTASDVEGKTEAMAGPEGRRGLTGMLHRGMRTRDSPGTWEARTSPLVKDPARTGASVTCPLGLGERSALCPKERSESAL
jgi:hypothetical protein